MAFDSEGEMFWQRVDSYYFDNDSSAAETAAEYVIKTQRGQFALVIDQGFGIGLLVFK